MLKPALLTIAYYASAAIASWIAIEGSGPANGGPNGGMLFAAGVVVVSSVIALISLIRTFTGNKSTQISTCIHLLVVLSFYSWWSSLR
jgi:hypothetical protein